jgi:hypothetical protein
MKPLHYPILALAASFALGAASCSDELGDIGSDLTRGEVSITVDSSYTVKGRSVDFTQFDSKNATLMLGHLDAPKYGSLDCSFVSRLMPAIDIDIPDTIAESDITGMRLKFMIANGNIVGDSLAPQQVSIYKLNKQLPNDIDNNFDPTGYYDPTPIAQRTYTASALGMNDTVTALSYRLINIDLPVDMARKLYSTYRTNPSLFAWPDKFAEVFPGIFAKNTFGKGLVVNIGNTEFVTYYKYKTKKVVVVDNVATYVDTTAIDSATVFTISPEVLSSNNISLKPDASLTARVAQGDAVFASPGGYNVEVKFPAQEVIDTYKSATYNLAVVNSLSLSIPVSTISNDYDIAPAKYMLMIKSSKLQEFFNTNSTPQGYVGEETDTDAFWTTYDSDTSSYTFSSLRPYILDLMEKDTITEDDCTFTILPVTISTETYGSSYSYKTFVSTCLPYIASPTMGVLNLDKAKVKFTFATQNIK